MNFGSLFLRVAATGILFPVSFAAHPQATAPPPSGIAPSTSGHLAFAVASIHLHPGPWHVIEGFTASGPRLSLEAYNLRGLIQEAYDLRGYRISFAGSNIGPDEDSDTRYDIAAVAEGKDAPTREEFRQMLQTLLAERFELRFHRETREMRVYAMVVAKSGPKLIESTPESVAQGHFGVHGRNQTVTESKATMDTLANDIGNIFAPRLPVIDRTGLTGTYAIQLEATPEFRINNNPQPEDISIFDAVQEQLGLKLEAKKAAVEVLVIDHIERPSEN